MMLILAGTSLVIVALVDVAWTTVAAGSGGGPLTTRIGRYLSRGALTAYRRRPSHRVLGLAGVGIVLALLGVWIVLVLAGWSLMFNGSDGAVLGTLTSQPADLVVRLYFVGYTVFTLGNGDFSPGSGAWQLATVVATGTGLMLVTLSITYLVPVASAVAERRQLASTIDALGDSSYAIVIRAWIGTGSARFPSTSSRSAR